MVKKFKLAVGAIAICSLVSGCSTLGKSTGAGAGIGAAAGGLMGNLMLPGRRFF